MRGEVDAMRVRLKGLNSSRKRLADGTVLTYWYAWRGGPRLPGKPGSPEFIAAFNEAVASRKRAPTEKTLRSLIDAFQDSEDFRALAPKTAKDYRRILAQIDRAFGDCPTAALEDPRIRGDFLEWRDELAKVAPRSADYTFTVFARVLSFGVNRGKIATNLLQRPGRVWKGSRSDKIWTEDDEAKLLAVASPRITLAFLIALWTAQRQGDVLRLTWNAYDGEFIRLKQSKTGVYVEVAVSNRLKAILNSTPRVSPTIVTTEEGRPYTSDGFRATWRKTCQWAGIKGLTFHDLRGTAVTRLAKSGATVPEIATLTGHSVSDVNSILDKNYLNRDRAMGVTAIRKLEKRTKISNRASNQTKFEDGQPS